MVKASYKVCTPTHKSALIANAIPIYNLSNINPVNYTQIKTTVEKLKLMVQNGYLLMKLQ